MEFGATKIDFGHLINGGSICNVDLTIQFGLFFFINIWVGFFNT
jgi:hypothetical protein